MSSSYSGHRMDQPTVDTRPSRRTTARGRRRPPIIGNTNSAPTERNYDDDKCDPFSRKLLDPSHRNVTPPSKAVAQEVKNNKGHQSVGNIGGELTVTQTNEKLPKSPVSSDDDKVSSRSSKIRAEFLKGKSQSFSSESSKAYFGKLSIKLSSKKKREDIELAGSGNVPNAKIARQSQTPSPIAQRRAVLQRFSQSCSLVQEDDLPKTGQTAKRVGENNNHFADAQKQEKRQNTARKLMRRQTSSDQSRSRGTSPDSQAFHHNSYRRPEKQNSSEQSRSSTPDSSHGNVGLKKQSSSVDEDYQGKFDILWRHKADALREQSPLASNKMGENSDTAGKQVLKSSMVLKVKPNVPKRQGSLDSNICSPDIQEAKYSNTSEEKQHRNSGTPKLRRQKQICIEESEGNGSREIATLYKSSPSLVVTKTENTNEVCEISSRAKSVPPQLGLEKSNSEEDWEKDLLEVLDAKAVSASNSPATTPDGIRRPGILRRLKSLSGAKKRKSTNEYGKGMLVAFCCDGW